MGTLADRKKLRKGLLGALVVLSLQGCAKKPVELEYDKTLSERVSDELTDLTSALDIGQIELKCASNTGPLEAELTYAYGWSDHKKTIKSNTPCTEKGLLLRAAFIGPTSSVETRFTYPSTLVVPELRKVITTYFGTLHYNLNINARTSPETLKQFIGTGLLHADFSCDRDKGVVLYKRFDDRTTDGTTGRVDVSCKYDPKDIPVFMRVRVSKGNDASVDIITSAKMTQESVNAILEGFIKASLIRQTF